MTLRTAVAREVREALRVGPVVFLPVALLIAAATVAVLRAGRHPYELFRDPAAIMHTSPLLGLFSNLGALIWCAAATSALLAAAVAHRVEPRGEQVKFFLAAGMLTATLLVDDFFQLHEYTEAYLRIPQYVFYAAYLLALLAYLARFSGSILRSQFSLLLLAAAFLGLSAVTDVLSERFDPQDTITWRIAFEDGFKLLGIVGWCVYHVRTAFDSIVRRPVQ